MTNKEKYINAFVEGLEIDADIVKEGLEYQGIPEWDSVGHMGLIACLEDAFDIMMDTEDIIDFSSFEKGKEILKNFTESAKNFKKIIPADYKAIMAGIVKYEEQGMDAETARIEAFREFVGTGGKA